jgi:hypothetical protein
VSRGACSRPHSPSRLFDAGMGVPHRELGLFGDAIDAMVVMSEPTFT